jgi:lipid-A-disaccharide synthase
VDELLTIHAFDAPWFEKAGLPTTFVGNPVLKPTAPADPAGFRRLIGASPDDQILVIAPGSRRREIDRLMGPFAEATRILSSQRPDLKVVVLAAESVGEAVATSVNTWPTRPHLATSADDRRDAMAAATAALACSGTVTTELAMAGTPMVVAYRLDPPTAAIARLLIRTPYITLFNVAAGRAVAPELLQDQCTGPKLAAALAPLLEDRAARHRQAAEQSAALEIMRGGVDDPAGSAAEAVLATLPS